MTKAPLYTPETKPCLAPPLSNLRYGKYPDPGSTMMDSPSLHTLYPPQKRIKQMYSLYRVL